MSANAKTHDLPGVVGAVLFICLGALLLYDTRGMTPMGSVFPVVIASAMIALAGILVVQNVLRGRRRPFPAAGQSDMPVTEQPAESMPRRAGFIAAMFGWIFLMPLLGFFVSSLIAFGVITALACHERPSAREAVMLFALGLVILVGFYLLMVYVLLIPLPQGIFF